MVVSAAQAVFRHTALTLWLKSSRGEKMLCLTIDIDWAHDVVIADTLELIEHHGFKVTWFFTHKTPMYEEIRAARGHEVGVHPNFNPLLEAGGGTAQEILTRVLDVVPGALCVRSHSLLRSSRIDVLFRSVGLTHESNYFIPPSLGSLPVWRDSFGLIQVPIRWEDDVRLIDASIGEPVHLLGQIAPLILDFHPIHIFLNTVTPNDYESARPFFGDPEKLQSARRPLGSGGTRDRLVSLLNAARRMNVRSNLLSRFAPQDRFR